jgi:hypothetical protein
MSRLFQAQSDERLGYPTQKPLAPLDRIAKASSNEGEIILDAFCGCGTALEAAQKLNRQWIGIDTSPTACRVMAKRLRDECKSIESEQLRRIRRGFVVRDLPWSEEKLRKLPPFEFENWAVIALGGVKNSLNRSVIPTSAQRSRRRRQGARRRRIHLVARLPSLGSSWMRG